MVVFHVSPRKFVIQTWFCNCPQYFCLFHIVFEYTPSIHGQGKMLDPGRFTWIRGRNKKRRSVIILSPMVIDFSRMRILRHTTQLYRLNLSTALFFDFLLGCSSASVHHRSGTNVDDLDQITCKITGWKTDSDKDTERQTRTHNDYTKTQAENWRLCHETSLIFDKNEWFFEKKEGESVFCIFSQNFETHGRVPKITWRVRTLSLRKFRHGILPLVPEGLSSLWPELFEGIFPSVCAFAFGAREDDCPSCPWSRLFPDAGSLLKQHEPPFENCPIASTDSMLPLSYPGWHFSLFASWLLLLFPLFRCRLWTFRVPHCLTNMTSYCCLQSGIAWWFVVSNIHSLVRTEPILSDAEQNPAILTCFHLPGPFLLVFHLLLIELGPIVCRNLERHHPPNVFWTNLRVYSAGAGHSWSICPATRIWKSTWPFSSRSYHSSKGHCSLAQGTSNKMHVWVLGCAMLTCASTNLIEMPEWFFSVPMENWWSNLGVGLFRAPQQLTFFQDVYHPAVDSSLQLVESPDFLVRDPV